MRRYGAGHLLLAVCLLASGPQPGRVRWFGADRVKHFFMSFFVQSASYTTLRAVNVGDRSALVGATAATAAVAVSKEVWDRRRAKRFDLGDLAWDALGAGAASLLLVRTADDK